MAENPGGKPKMEQNIRNCPNCGAPRTGTICEYCGTIFYNQDYIDIRKAQKSYYNALSSCSFPDYYNAVSSCWFPDYYRRF